MRLDSKHKFKFKKQLERKHKFKFKNQFKSGQVMLMEILELRSKNGSTWVLCQRVDRVLLENSKVISSLNQSIKRLLWKSNMLRLEVLEWQATRKHSKCSGLSKMDKLLDSMVMIGMESSKVVLVVASLFMIEQII